MKAKLINIGPCERKRKVVLSPLPLVLGRAEDVEIRLGDQWVSRRHCEIDLIDGTLVVRDMGSKHGTYVNGRRILRSELLPGDELTMGLTSFTASYRRVPR